MWTITQMGSNDKVLLIPLAMTIIMEVDSFSCLNLSPYLSNKGLSLLNLNFFFTHIFRNLTEEKYYNS